MLAILVCLFSGHDFTFRENEIGVGYGRPLPLSVYQCRRCTQIERRLFCREENNG